MDGEIITDELTNRILHTLETDFSFKQESVTFEVQDDGACVMIYIPVDEVPEASRPLVLEQIGTTLNEIIPGRTGDYSWFANFTLNGTIIDSCFGGNLEFPKVIF